MFPSHSQQSKKTPNFGLKHSVILKLIVFGEGGVGKTTMINRLLTGQYYDTQMTIGSGFATYEINVEKQDLLVVIWDFGGEERFRFLLPQFCTGAHGGIMGFDLSRPDTFLKLDNWLELVRNKCPNIPIVLVGMKSDLPHQLPKALIRNFQEQNNLTRYIPTSAKRNINIHEALYQITKDMWNYYKLNPSKIS